MSYIRTNYIGDLIGYDSSLNPVAGLFAEGGSVHYLRNDTGGNSVLGLTARVSTAYNHHYKTTVVSGIDKIGVVGLSGIANGALTPIIRAGFAWVMLEDGTAANKGDWLKTSSVQAGRVIASATKPDGSTIALIQEYMRQIGYCLYDAVAGTNVLAKAFIIIN